MNSNKEVLAALTGLRRSAPPLTKAVFALSQKDYSVGLDSAERLSDARGPTNLDIR